MIIRQPTPFDPGQLPPRTDDFGFVNLTDTRVDHATIEGRSGLTPGDPSTTVIDMRGPSGGIRPHRARGRAGMGLDCRATEIEGHAQIGPHQFTYTFTDTPPGHFICSVILGVVRQQDGEIYGFGVVTFDDGTTASL